MIFSRVGRFLDDRTGSGSLLSRGFRYVFPDHWTFLFGEIASTASSSSSGPGST